MEPLGWGAAGVVIIVIFAWWVVGTAVASQEAPRDREHEDKCAQCKLDKAYFDSLPDWKKALEAAWYAVIRIACTLKGC